VSRARGMIDMLATRDRRRVAEMLCREMNKADPGLAGARSAFVLPCMVFSGSFAPKS
jgi:hypothetical protein